MSPKSQKRLQKYILPCILQLLAHDRVPSYQLCALREPQERSDIASTGAFFDLLEQ